MEKAHWDACDKPWEHSTRAGRYIDLREYRYIPKRGIGWDNIVSIDIVWCCYITSFFCKAMPVSPSLTLSAQPLPPLSLCVYPLGPSRPVFLNHSAATASSSVIQLRRSVKLTLYSVAILAEHFLSLSSERMTALVMSYYRKLLKSSVNTTLIILDLVLWMEVTTLSPERNVSSAL